VSLAIRRLATPELGSSTLEASRARGLPVANWKHQRGVQRLDSSLPGWWERGHSPALIWTIDRGDPREARQSDPLDVRRSGMRETVARIRALGHGLSGRPDAMIDVRVASAACSVPVRCWQIPKSAIRGTLASSSKPSGLPSYDS
jgi:hypothetical protein